MANEQQRHDISDKVWELLEPLLPGQEGRWGGIAKDNRRFLNTYSGIYVRVHLGETYHQYTGNGTAYFNALDVGVTKAYGKKCWKL